MSDQIPSFYPADQNQDTLGVLIPSAKGRKIAYAIYSLISFIAGAGLAYCAAAGIAPLAPWALGAVAVITFSGSLFGVTATANVKGK